MGKIGHEYEDDDVVMGQGWYDPETETSYGMTVRRKVEAPKAEEQKTQLPKKILKKDLEPIPKAWLNDLMREGFKKK